MVWPPSGWAFFIVCLMGYCAWPGLALGALAVNLLNDGSWSFALATAIGNPIPAILSYYLLHTYTNFDYRLSQTTDVYKFVTVACITTTTISAIIGTSLLAVEGTIPTTIFGTVFASWWLGDATGVLLFSPILLTYRQWKELRWSPTGIVEVLTLTSLAVLLGSVMLTDFFELLSTYQVKTSPIMLYLLFPICMWASVRFWHTGAVSFTFLFTVFALYGSVKGIGPFVLGNPYLTLFHMNIFLAVLMIVSLTLAATASTLRLLKLKLTEEALRDSEARFRDFADISADWLWETNERMELSYLSNRYEEITGLNMCDRLGTSLLDFQNLTTSKYTLDIHKIKIENRQAFKAFEFDLVTSPETILHLSSNDTPIINQAGAFIGYRGSVTDITEQKKAEVALLESGQRIARFNIFLTEIINHQDFINGHYLAFLDTVSRLLCDVLETSRVSIWKLDSSVSSIECLSLWSNEDQTHSTGPVLRKNDFPSYFDALTKGRTLVFNDVYHNPTVAELARDYFPKHEITSMLNAPFHAGGSMAGVLCIAHTRESRHWKIEEESFIISVTDILSIVFEISLRKELEETLRHTQKMEAVGKLTGGVAHEYNNMLGIILGYAELLSDEFEDRSIPAEYLKNISHAGQRGATLTQKLLSFSKSKSADPENIDINSLLLNHQEMLAKTLTARIQLIFHLSPNLWQALLCPNDFEGAVLNMSINAMHAIEGTGAVTVRTGNTYLNKKEADVLSIKEGDYVALSITDTGSGISAADKSKIFDPFYTTKGDLGSGLGLSQVYGFVQSSDAAIRVTSTPGCTEITLYFPRANENSNVTISTVIDEANQFRGTEIVLLVDDEPALLALMNEILGEHGYTVFCANSANEALHLLEIERVDVLLSDVIMPEMDGYQLASIAREKYPNIKIQLTSGYTGDNNINSIENDLNKVLLHKPYTAVDLLKRIRSLIDDCSIDLASRVAGRTNG